jgi:2-succinyl-6-hydroxy-2,4-cyclohexadiene-1-carboxylate synthase
LQRSYHRLVFLHGFLGSSEDWEDVIRHLPEYFCEALSYPFQIPSNAIVIGYSMGGRIALRSSQPKILLSTHPGLQTVQEKAERLYQDQQWIKKLHQETLESFLQAWYAQPLFDSLRRHPGFPKILSRRMQQNPLELAQILEKESLAHQNFILPEATFLHGELDKKFVRLYQDLKIYSIAVPNAGHAAHLENPKECAKIIRQVEQSLLLKDLMLLTDEK